jgi:hypothetical protein
MHASIEELLSLRDGEADAERVAAHVASCGRCRTQLQQLRDTRDALGALPLVAPDRTAWAAITARAAQPPRRSPWWPRAVAGLAAAAALVAVLAVRDEGTGPAPQAPLANATPATQTPATRTPAAVATRALDTDALVARSHRLEAALAQMPVEPAVVNAGTAATIATLEDYLALVDYRLSRDVEEPLAPEQSHLLWQQRVDLMNSLVNVRYAQLQRVDY